MSDAGYIKISRKILNWEWFTDHNTFRMFVYLLLKANWKDTKYMGITIPRGSLATTLPRLSENLGLSIQQSRTALSHIKSTGEITVTKYPKYSVITIKNYERYQTGNSQNNSQTTVNQQAEQQAINTPIEEEIKNKELKEKVSNDTQKKTDSGSAIYTTIRDLYSSVCGSYPHLVKMTDKRKNAIKARFNQGYTVGDFRTLFEKAEASEFLKGGNDRNWQADFDWLITDRNMARVLEGKYDKKRTTPKPVGKTNKFNNFEQRKYDFADYERRLLNQ